MPESSALERPLPRVSVIVPTYNRKANLRAVVAPLLGDPATHEVVVVVDGCDDGSFELLTALAETEPRLVPVLIANRGTSGAHQSGVERASGDVVLLLADDVIAAPGLATGHARRHREGSGLVVVGYMPIAGGRLREPGRLASCLYARDYERACDLYEAEPQNILRYLWGGNVSLHRSDCLRVPVHSPDFTATYHEDQEFGIRCLKSGLHGVFDRHLLAEHVHTRSLSGMLSDARKMGAGRKLVHHLHPDVLGPFDPGVFDGALPVVARWAVHAARRPAARSALLGVLIPVVGLAGRLRLFIVEVRAAQLLRRIEMQAGALANCAPVITRPSEPL